MLKTGFSLLRVVNRLKLQKKIRSELSTAPYESSSVLRSSSTFVYARFGGELNVSMIIGKCGNNFRKSLSPVSVYGSFTILSWVSLPISTTEQTFRCQLFMPVHGLIYRGNMDTIGARSLDALFVIINELHKRGFKGSGGSVRSCPTSKKLLRNNLITQSPNEVVE